MSALRSTPRRGDDAVQAAGGSVVMGGGSRHGSLIMYPRPALGRTPGRCASQRPRHHLLGRYDLRLLDKNPRGDPAVLPADLSAWGPGWVEQFRGADVVVHLAADPAAQQTWPHLMAPNVDAVIHAFQAAVRGGVR